jgi:hypothetical protein
VEVLLRLARRHVSRRKTRGQAAQQERTEAENCLVRRTGYANFTHAHNYMNEIVLCKKNFCHGYPRTRVQVSLISAEFFYLAGIGIFGIAEFEGCMQVWRNSLS